MAPPLPGAASARDRAPWIRIWRLRVANLRSAQQRNGKKRKDRHTHHRFPIRRFCLPRVLAACSDLNAERRRVRDAKYSAAASDQGLARPASDGRREDSAADLRERLDHHFCICDYLKSLGYFE